MLHSVFISQRLTLSQNGQEVGNGVGGKGESEEEGTGGVREIEDKSAGEVEEKAVEIVEKETATDAKPVKKAKVEIEVRHLPFPPPSLTCLSLPSSLPPSLSQPPSRCVHCRQFLDSTDLTVFVGDPENAVS